MYSPKIAEALIPRIYRAAKAADIPMTEWVNRAIAGALLREETSQPNGIIVLEYVKMGEPERPEINVQKVEV